MKPNARDMGSVARATALTLGTMVVTLVVGIASRIVLTRGLGVANMGRYAALVLIPTMGSVLGGLGINSANVHFASARRATPPMLATLSIVGAGLSALIAAPFVAIAVWWPNGPYSDIPTWLGLAMVAGIPLMTLTANLLALTQGLRRFKAYNFISVLGPLVLLASLIVWVALLHLGLVGAIGSWFTMTAATSVLAIVVLRRELSLQWHRARALVRPLVAYSAWPFGANLLGMLSRRVDVLMVKAMSGSTELGWYAVAFGLGELMWYLATAASAVIAPVVGAAPGAREAGLVTARVNRTVVALLVPAGLVTSVVARPLINLLFGAAFAHAAVDLQWLIPGILVTAVDKILSADLIGRGKPAVALISSAIAVGIDIPLNLVLIPRYGGMGAAIASSVSYTAATVFTLVCYTRIADLRLADLFVISWRELMQILTLSLRQIRKVRG